MESFESALEQDPSARWPREFLITTYGHLNQPDDAAWEIEQLEAEGYEVSIEAIENDIALRDPSYREVYLAGLHKAGLPE